MIKFAEPITGVNDSNGLKDQDSTNSSLSIPKKSKFEKVYCEIETESAAEKIVTKQSQAVEEELKWMRHLNSLKCYKECLSIGQNTYVPNELVTIAQMHLQEVIKTSKDIYGELPVAETAKDVHGEQPVVETAEEVGLGKYIW